MKTLQALRQRTWREYSLSRQFDSADSNVYEDPAPATGASVCLRKQNQNGESGT